MRKSLFLVFLICLNFICLSQEKGDSLCNGVIKESSIKFNDIITGASVTIFESEKNSEYLAKKQYSLMKFYISPLCQFMPLNEKGTIFERLELQKTVRYSLKIQYYHKMLYSQAAEAINLWLSSFTSEYKITNPSTQIFNLPHSVVGFKIKDMSDIKISPIGSAGSIVNLPSEDWLYFYVTKEIDADFYEMMKSSSGISFEIAISFLDKDISKESSQYASTKNFIIPASTGKVQGYYSIVNTFSTEMAKLTKIAEKNAWLAYPIIWSGGASKHGTAGGWNVYLTDRTDYNTAQDYLDVNPNGTITVKVDGYYRINFWCISYGAGNSYVGIWKNGSYFHHGYNYVHGNQWIDNFADVTWNFKKGDTIQVKVHNPSSYAYHAWSAAGSYGRLQVQYAGPLKE